MCQCTCGAGLELGPNPEDLKVTVIPGEPWGRSLVLDEYDPQTGTTTVISWPTEPVLEFGDPEDPIVSVTAVLSTDPDTSTVGAVASWSMGEGQVALLADFMPVRLTVDDETWAIGVVSCLS